MGVAKYPKVESTTDLLKLSLAQDFLPSEPYISGVKSIKAYCLISNRSCEVNIEKLRRGIAPHLCCEKLKKYQSIAAQYEPYPKFVESGKCPTCGKSGLTDQLEESVQECAHCKDEDKFWQKGGTISYFQSKNDLLVDLSNGSPTQVDRIDENFKLVFSAIIPPRDPEGFVRDMKEFARSRKWTIPDWYLSDWNQGEKHVWRHINWVAPGMANQLVDFAELVLDKLSGDTKYQLKVSRKPKKRAQKPTADMSQGDEVVVEGELPMPIVHYPPARKGLIFAFSASSDSAPFICDCAKNVLETIRLIGGYSSIKLVMSDSLEIFPITFAEAFKSQDQNPIDEFFRPGICHACCKVFPSLMSSTYEHGSFVYRWLYWYDKQEHYLNGFDYPWYHQIPVRSEDEFTENLSIVQTLNTPDFNRPVYQKARDRVRNLLNLLVKERFEILSMGGSSHAEITILKMVKELLPQEKVVSHFRPDWLNGLEIDIWLPEMNVGIEYQGEQHYHPIEIWGGEIGLKDLQIRDKRKRKICENRGVRLIEIKYDQKVSKFELENLLAN
jgi:hypothetical protein